MLRKSGPAGTEPVNRKSNALPLSHHATQRIDDTVAHVAVSDSTIRPRWSRHLLSTHADRQVVDMSVTVCVFVFFVRLRISPPRIKLAASNFAPRFIGGRGSESPIFVNFASPKAQNQTNRPARQHFHDVHNDCHMIAR